MVKVGVFLPAAKLQLVLLAWYLRRWHVKTWNRDRKPWTTKRRQIASHFHGRMIKKGTDSKPVVPSNFQEPRHPLFISKKKNCASFVQKQLRTVFMQRLGKQATEKPLLLLKRNLLFTFQVIAPTLHAILISNVWASLATVPKYGPFHEDSFMLSQKYRESFHKITNHPLRSIEDWITFITHVLVHWNSLLIHSTKWASRRFCN